VGHNLNETSVKVDICLKTANFFMSDYFSVVNLETIDFHDISSDLDSSERKALPFVKNKALTLKVE